VLPLISRQWQRVLSGPSDAWRTVPLSTDYEDLVRHPSTRPDVEQRRNAAAALRWFKSRPGCVGIRSRVDQFQFASVCSRCHASSRCLQLSSLLGRCVEALRHLSVSGGTCYELSHRVLGAILSTQASSIRHLMLGSYAEVTSLESAYLVSWHVAQAACSVPRLLA